MKVPKPFSTKPSVLLISLAAIFLFFPLFSPGPLSSADPEEGLIQIVIVDRAFHFKGGILRPGEEGTIYLHNQDPVRHGFTSGLLSGLEVIIESEMGEVYGKGIRGVYINPGEIIEIRLTPIFPGKFQFRCDLHPEMTGELLMLSIDAV